jgi:polyhydroxybutyrate depolymerase
MRPRLQEPLSALQNKQGQRMPALPILNAVIAVAVPHSQFNVEEISPRSLVCMQPFSPFSTFGMRGLTRKEWQVDGTPREALVSLPEKTAGAPLIVAFHGYGGTAAFAARRWHLHSLWPEAVVVYPQGLPTSTPRDLRGRQAGWQMMDIQGKPNRDRRLFDAILHTARKEWKCSEKRIYVTGHSNGGGFTYYLWGQNPVLFAAIAPVSGGGERLIHDAKPCPILIIAAKNDPIVLWETQKKAIDAARSINGSRAPVETFLHDKGHAYPEQGPEKIIAFFKKHYR